MLTVPKLDVARVVSRALAILATCWFAWIPVPSFAQVEETDDYPDAQLSEAHWRQRVEEARRRTEAFVASVRSRQNETPARSVENAAKTVDERIMNDDGLQRGDIVSTSKGLFVFMGRGNSDSNTGTVQPSSGQTPEPVENERR